MVALQNDQKPTPFTVASSIAPIPAKLVKKIKSMEYVHMRPDNIALADDGCLTVRDYPTEATGSERYTNDVGLPLLPV